MATCNGEQPESGAKAFRDEMTVVLKTANEHPETVSREEELEQQQGVYSKLSEYFDKSTKKLFGYKGHVLTAKHLDRLYPNEKDIKILDFGGGTGLAAEEMIKCGFHNIYGIDINKSMLEEAQKKKCYKGLYLNKANDIDSLDFLFDNSFDAIVSAGTFYCSLSHAGTEYFEKMCNIVRPGGKILIVTAEVYCQASYIKWDEIERLERLGRLRSHPVIVEEVYKANHKGKVFVYDVLQ